MMARLLTKGLVILFIAILARDGHGSKNTESKHPYCVAILTGYPDVPSKKPFILRVVNEILKVYIKPKYDFHVHVFCQGECTDIKNVVSHNVHLHYLSNTVDRTVYRGFIISQNYQKLLDVIFGKHSAFSFSSKKSCGDKDCEYCIIVEDDLLFSPDAFDYFEKGINLMSSDATVFAVSAYNDNSFPWVVSDSTFFRRVSHFSGCGFVISKKTYEELILPNWDHSYVWDALFQKIMIEKEMVCIQPEISRVRQTKNSIMQHVNEKGPLDNYYDAHVVEKTAEHEINLDKVEEDVYDWNVRLHIFASIPINYLNDAGFYAEHSGKRTSLRLVVNTTYDIHNILVTHGLIGRGLGGVTRGIYKDTVFLRPYGIHTLIIAQTSPFMHSLRRTDHSVMDFIVSGFSCQSNFVNVEAMARKDIWDGYKGAIYWLLTEVFTVSDHGSCDSICADRNMKCSLPGLYILNQHCQVMKGVFHRCNQGVCHHFNEESPLEEWNDQPSFLPAVERGNEIVCKQQIPYQLNCEARLDDPFHKKMRLCACSKKGK